MKKRKFLVQDNEFDIELKKKDQKIYKIGCDVAQTFAELYAKKEVLSMFSEKDPVFAAMQEEYGAYKRMLCGQMEEFDECLKQYNDYYDEHQNDLSTTKMFTFSNFKNATELLQQIMMGILLEQKGNNNDKW